MIPGFSAIDSMTFSNCNFVRINGQIKSLEFTPSNCDKTARATELKVSPVESETRCIFMVFPLTALIGFFHWRNNDVGIYDYSNSGALRNSNDWKRVDIIANNLTNGSGD